MVIILKIYSYMLVNTMTGDVLGTLGAAERHGYELKAGRAQSQTDHPSSVRAKSAAAGTVNGQASGAFAQFGWNHGAYASPRFGVEFFYLFGERKRNG